MLYFVINLSRNFNNLTQKQEEEQKDILHPKMDLIPGGRHRLLSYLSNEETINS